MTGGKICQKLFFFVVVFFSYYYFCAETLYIYSLYVHIRVFIYVYVEYIHIFFRAMRTLPIGFCSQMFCFPFLLGMFAFLLVGEQAQQ